MSTGGLVLNRLIVVVGLLCGSISYGDGTFESYGACRNCGEIMYKYPCEHCGWPWPNSSPSGSSGGTGSSTLPTPRNAQEMQQYMGMMMMQSLVQGIQQGIADAQAAQQEETRRAAEAERQRQEFLKKAAEEARVTWQEQDAANMAAFGLALSSKKTGSGMPPLLMKQAQQSSGAWNDPNVVDLRDITNRIPRIPGGGTAKISDGGFVGPLGAPVPRKAPPAPPVIQKPPPAYELMWTDLLPEMPSLPPEYIACIKKLSKGMGSEYAMMALKDGMPVAAKFVSFAQNLKEGLNIKDKIVGAVVGSVNTAFDVANTATVNAGNRNFDDVELANTLSKESGEAMENVDEAAREGICSVLGKTSKEAKLGENVLGAANLNLKHEKVSGE